MNVLGRIFLNSHKERRKDGFFLWDVEEFTFLIKRFNIILNELSKGLRIGTRGKQPPSYTLELENFFGEIFKQNLKRKISYHFSTVKYIKKG